VAFISSGGQFAGHFFGVNDEWANDEAMTFPTAGHVKNLFRNFEKELFLEKESSDERHFVCAGTMTITTTRP
jgi:hypothetical protein